MKRSSLNSHRQYISVDEEDKTRLKHQTLLLEFLELQKEFVSKKKKLQTVDRKRETLLAEVRFLRQRYNYLSVNKSREYEPPQCSVQSQNPYLQLQSKSAKSYDVNDAVERRPCFPHVNPNLANEEKGQRNVRVPLRKEKKPKNGLINGKRVGKKKISWKDQVALEV